MDMDYLAGYKLGSMGWPCPSVASDNFRAGHCEGFANLVSELQN